MVLTWYEKNIVGYSQINKPQRVCIQYVQCTVCIHAYAYIFLQINSILPDIYPYYSYAWILYISWHFSNMFCDPVLMKFCHICRWLLAIFNLLGVPDGRALQPLKNSDGVRKVHDHRKMYYNFQRLTCYCLTVIGTCSVVQCSKPHSSGTPSRLKLF